MDIRSLQKPLKEHYRNDPNASRITLRAKGGQTGAPVACSVDIGRAIYQAEAHKGVGGTGAGACSGDLLLGALAACAQITCQMVAAAMGIPTERIEVMVDGDMDLRGTLGISKEVPVGFESIRLNFDVVAPKAAGTTAWIARENRAVLRGDADFSPAAEPANRVDWSGLNPNAFAHFWASLCVTYMGEYAQPCHIAWLACDCAAGCDRLDWRRTGGLPGDWFANL